MCPATARTVERGTAAAVLSENAEVARSDVAPLHFKIAVFDPENREKT
jgi:hypothetical protein